MVGKSIILYMNKEKIKNLCPDRKELDLINYSKVSKYFKKNKFDYIINCAAKVGGILENSNNQISFYRENAEINHNLIKCAHENKIKNFINMGSSCMYPSNYNTKISEKKIMSGPLEESNLGYGMAKVTSSIYLKLIREETGYNYSTIIPCNLYGHNDNFKNNKSHLIASIIKKVHEAKINNKKYIEVWGNGKVKREFLYVDDLAIFVTKLIKNKEKLPELMNVGYGKDFSVIAFYKKVMKAYNYNVELKFDKSKPNGVNRKLIDSRVAKQKYGFKINTTLEKGINNTISYYEKNYV
jgi:nucleoside-diphosphate-sugar epimerase|tara:strand:+ start:2012 stop:2902 length:891 start_codon:yes stop_codon:yes gene_type:complete